MRDAASASVSGSVKLAATGAGDQPEPEDSGLSVTVASRRPCGSRAATAVADSDGRCQCIRALLSRGSLPFVDAPCSAMHCDTSFAALSMTGRYQFYYAVLHIIALPVAVHLPVRMTPGPP